mgnify:CR=1 FL=1
MSFQLNGYLTPKKAYKIQKNGINSFLLKEGS